MNNLFNNEAIKKMFDLTGKKALVTGAAAGLGEAIAWGMACFGADVVAADVDLEGARQVADAIKNSLGKNVLPVQVDVTQESQVKAMVKAALDNFGTIDISFNNPGINCRKTVLDLSLEEYERVLKVNLIGTFLCAKEVGRVMVEKRSGKMINMASVFGHVVMPTHASYGSSKGAIIQLTKVLALEWAPYNVQVNALAPAHHKTKLTRHLMDNTELYQDILSRIPQNRFAEVEEIIGPAVFLASRASDFVTGISLIMDGGWTAQ